MVSALQKAHIGVQEASTEGKPQLHHREPWVPHVGRLPDPQAVPGGPACCPGQLGATPALAAPGGHPILSQPQGKARPQVPFSPREQYLWGTDFSAGWLFILSGLGDAVNDVERGCKMG